jgi:hypothetical protein
MAQPKLSPYLFPDLVCATCGQGMRRDVSIVKLEIRALYYCDSDGCRYGFKAYLEHTNGVLIAYAAPPNLEQATKAQPLADASQPKATGLASDPVQNDLVPTTQSKE